LVNAGKKMKNNQHEYEYAKHYFEKGMEGWHQQSFETITTLFDAQFREKK